MMKYNILDYSLASRIADEYNVGLLAAKVLASKSNEVIKDVLNYKKEAVIFDNIEEACRLIYNHINNNSKIVIMGDYDCGATS